MQISNGLKRKLAGGLASVLGIAWLPAMAAPLALSQAPLFLAIPQKPNLLVTLDDSGSMTWAYVPDAYGSDMQTGTSFSPKRIFSADYNSMYYNPATTYSPPLKADGTSFSTSFSAAYYNGFDPSQGSVDLRTAYRPTKDYNPTGASHTLATHPNDLTALGVATKTTAGPAYYYTLDKTNSGCASPFTADACYDVHLVTAETAAQQQNFANWYSFYRTRNLAVASAATLAFSQLDGGIRLAYQSINKCNSFNDSCQGWDSVGRKNKIRRFESNKADFYNWLSRLPASGSTPLRTAYQRVGNYVMNASLGDGDVYAFDPNVSGGANPKYACRSTYAVLMTDGMWNSDTPTACTGVAGCTSSDIDGTGYTLPDGKVYSPINPYKDGTGTANNLADIAFAYWSRDLRTDIGNQIIRRRADKDPTKTSPDATVLSKWTDAEYWAAQNDPANWQHIGLYAIGLGLAKGLPLATPPLTWDPAVGTFGGSYPDIVSGATTWPVVSAGTDNPAKIADLWHAAINGRGRFYAAESASDVVKAFAEIVAAINTTEAAAGAAAANTQSFVAGAATYISVYHPNASPAKDTAIRPWWAALTSSDSQLWWGDMEKLPLVKTTGSPLDISSTPTWSAAAGLIHDASVVATPNKYVDARTILSYDPSKTGSAGAIPFRWASLSSSQQTAITGATSPRTGADRLNWLRGDATYEGDYDASSGKGGLRARPVTKLGDIVYSSPVLVSTPKDGWPDPTYAAFRSAKSSRTGVIYVGANDGMLHGFRESDGKEILGYVPSEVYPYLRTLTEASYPHRAYVDGHIQINDAQFSDGWHTVLVSGLRAGGKGYFALDVTTPSFSEGSPGSTVLWEFNSTTDSANIGYSYGRPVIAKLRNGKWAAIFGNGYNSTSGKAGLYIAYIEAGKSGWVSGSNFRFIDTGATVGASPNGLSSPAVIDIDGDGTADYAYAGDLYGNVWKFDLTSTSMAAWSVSKKLFSAVDTGGKAQPITTAPEVMLHPKGGYMVLVGTGKAIEDIDMADQSLQSFYGIWDSSSPDTITRSRMLQHVFTLTDTETPVNPATGVTYSWELRTVDKNTPNWYDPATNPTGQLGWYVDLKEGVSTLAAIGERVIEDPQALNGHVLFVSATPTNDPCNGGGSGWINEMDAITGARLPVPPFDLNEDLKYDDSDKMDTATEGRQSPTSRRVSPVGGLPVVIKDKTICPASGCGPASLTCNRLVKRSDGSVEVISGMCPASTGRLNWRDLTR
ncbi:type 4a pilus biogenesis protein PilY1 [Niveibacterium umoris]|uniref:Type IV pilus assembly protein PilY1 n=1 Tax=Niveibacterium umoris TaxID=1193620 RepID=A0A840BGD8_9RHOO|nr:PilC/PilY family type IV pilus protein [Niveibacterium umoris]MBB4010738.1 type IV pilus assembly protein PilY1 [Niveibacterium umoris]